MMMMNPNPLPAVPATIQSTAGAVPVKNDKGTFQLNLYINSNGKDLIVYQINFPIVLDTYAKICTIMNCNSIFLRLVMAITLH